ncbi:MAG: glycosyltransferase family 4 protein [Thermoplasmata archaeon]
MIIVLVTPYYFPVLGGYTLITQGLSKAFLEKEHEVKILTTMCESSYKEGNVITFDNYSLSFNEKAQILKGLNFYEKLFGYKEMTNIQRDMVLEVEKIKPDIVHTFGPIQFGFVGALSSARGFKWVHTFITQPPHRKSFIKKMMARKVFGRADLMTVTATNQVRDLKEKYGLEVGRAIKVGVDTAFFTPTSRLQQVPIVGAVSNFVWKEKVEGLILLIRAFKRLQYTYPDVKLKIVGDGKYRKLVEETIKQQRLENQVILLGRMNRDELKLFYQNISIFAHISYQDTLPLTVLEAMASGLPIVASRIGDIPQVVSEDVGSVINFDEEGISQALSKLLGSKDLRACLGKDARDKAEKEFSWYRVAKEYLSTYHDLLSSNRKKKRTK